MEARRRGEILLELALQAIVSLQRWMLGKYELLAPKQRLSVPACQIFQKFSKAILFLREKYQKGDRFVLKVADRK